jgi:hypothetical protein
VEVGPEAVAEVAAEAEAAAGSRNYVDFDDFAIMANNRLAGVEWHFGLV